MFSNRSIIFLFFVALIHIDNYIQILSEEALPRADYCIDQGTLCSEDCTTVLYCTGIGATPIPSINCSTLSPAQNCYSGGAASAQCSETQSDCPQGGQRLTVQCREAGTFPDPYNCRNSYTCESNNPEPTDQCLCPPGQVWAGPSVNCNNDTQQIESCCQQTVACDDPNTVGSNYGPCQVISSLGYYYICERNSGQTTISLHKCPDGQVWGIPNQRCETALILKVLPVCVSELTTTEPSTTGTTPTDQPTLPPPTCTYYGEVIPVEGDCRKYWVCNNVGGNLVPELRECELGTYLDCSQNGCYCVPGDCPT